MPLSKYLLNDPRAIDRLIILNFSKYFQFDIEKMNRHDTWCHAQCLCSCSAELCQVGAASWVACKLLFPESFGSPLQSRGDNLPPPPRTVRLDKHISQGAWSSTRQMNCQPSLLFCVNLILIPVLNTSDCPGRGNGFDYYGMLFLDSQWQCYVTVWITRNDIFLCVCL